IRATCTRGTLVTRRPFPSFVSTTMDPVSATPMFAPVTPTFASRNWGRSRARTADKILEGSGAIGSPYASVSIRAIRSEVMWIAGKTRWEGFSPATWQRSSPRSVSMARMPSAARPWFNSISSEVRDFDLTRYLPPYIPVEEDHMEGMGSVDSVKEAEFDVSRPARPRNERDRGSLPRSACAEHSSDDGHRLADVSDQPPCREQDDVHDR